MTGEPRVCTLACTPGATKALADAHARRTRRDLNIAISPNNSGEGEGDRGVNHRDAEHLVMREPERMKGLPLKKY